MTAAVPGRFWLETSGHPPHVHLLCCCGWRRTATTDAKAEALAAEHTRTHQTAVAS